MNTQRVCDRIHGEVRLSRLAAAVCTTEAFSRLDHIRQLGVCAFVYPSATHTRREHSIGVAHLARTVGQHLQALYPSKVDDGDIIALELAGLLHDVGHGPFSHLFEQFVHDTHPEWSHECMSLRIVDHVFDDDAHPLIRQTRDSPNGPELIATIKTLITGLPATAPVPTATGRGEAKRFLFEVVHATDHGIDVDKLDYLQRDNLSVFGRSNACSIARIVAATRVIGNRIAFDESVALEVSDLLALRARMHRQVYQQRAVLVAEGMVKDLIAAVNVVEGGMLIDALDDVDAYLALTDAFVVQRRPFAPECERKRVALHARPWCRRVPITVSLNTQPTCSACKGPTSVAAFACSHCGSTQPWVGVRLQSGLMASQGSLWTAKDVEAVVGASVYISDVTLGTATVREDTHGRMWHVFESRIPFCDKSERRLLDASGSAFPLCTHERTVYAYLPVSSTDDDLEEAARKLEGWGRTVGTTARM